MRLVEVNQPFPLVKREGHIDRSFKTITLPSNRKERIRIKAIDINNNVISSLEQKTIPLHIPASEFDSYQHRFRVRTKLSMDISGVRESKWVTQQHVDEAFASHVNQFRVRGVAKNGQRSDWVYSNIRKLDNEEVLFELIHDILDIVLYTQDNELDYLIDTAIEDTLTSLYQDELDFERTYNHQEQLESQISEVAAIFSNIFQKQLKERVFASPQEFTEFVRVYNIMDRFEEQQTDFLGLLLESFLDDQLKKIVEKTNYEIIARNDEEIKGFIQSIYELDIKRSLVGHLYDSDVYDRFDVTITDAVRLISDPIVYEEIIYKQNEEFYNLFKMMLKEIYVPFLVLAEKSVDLEHFFKDDISLDFTAEIIEFDMKEEDILIRHMLLRDIMELILSSADAELEEVTLDLLDHILTPFMETRLGLWIDYAPVELIEYMAEIRENIRHDQTKIRADFKYTKGSSIAEELERKHLKKDKGFRLTYQSALSDLHEIIEKNQYSDAKEEILSGLIDSLLFHDKHIEKSSHGVKSISSYAKVTTQDTKKEFVKKALMRVLFWDTLQYKDTTIYDYFKNDLSSGFDETHYNLYKPHIEEMFIDRSFDSLAPNVNPRLYDRFVMADDDHIHYSMDSHIGNAPLGKFIVGRHTLRGNGE